MRSYLQRLGKSFMLPVSILPVVSLLFGLGIALDHRGLGENSIIAAILVRAGMALIENIPLIIAVGIPIGLARERDGAAALSGLAGFLVLQYLISPESVAQYQGIALDAVDPAFAAADNVFLGILTGIVAAFLYDRFSQTELHSSLAFFSGKRLVPILAVLASVCLAVVLYFLWPMLYGILLSLGLLIKDLGAAGAGLYAFLNRMLIPTGLHHALNAVFWFDTVGINDLGNFWAGTGIKGITGRYMAGYFPVIMFGLPGAALAMYHTARQDQKQVTGSMLLAASITAFVTGLTEPLEFLFMFLSPFLYFVHALLTGLSMYIAALFQWTAGFNFSAGLMDFVFSAGMPMASHPLMLLVQGLVFFVLYYVLFRWLILKKDLKTPGREAPDLLEDLSDDSDSNKTGSSSHTALAELIYTGLGGSENLVYFDYCATRIRASVRDTSRIDRERIQREAKIPVVFLGTNNAQVIVGPKVQFVVDQMKMLDERAKGNLEGGDRKE